MHETRHNLSSPFVNPPTGSELASIVRHFEDVARSSETPDTILEFVASRAHELTVKTLVDRGMPAEWASDPPVWLEELIVLETAAFRSAALAEAKKQKRSRGRPSYPNALASVAGFHEWNRQREAAPAETRDNAIYSAVARQLGPGIDRSHVRRLMKFWRRRLGHLRATSPETFDSVLIASIRFGREIDNFREQRAAVRANSRRADRFYRAPDHAS